MKPDRRVILAVAALTVVLLGSISLNYLLFNQSMQYYLQLNGSRLDPLGLSHYSTAPDQRDLARPGLQTVVFFGDSRAADWTPPDLDQFEFVNRGIYAETSAQALLRFDYHVKPLMPDVVVVQVGINDLKAIPVLPDQKEAIVANCKENTRQIAEKATGSGAKVILTTIFPTGPVPLDRRLYWSDDVAVAIEEVSAFIRSLGGDDILILDAYSILANGVGSTRSEFSRDLLHLTAAGYRRLNDAFVPVLMGLASE
ncbi:MAG TPA: GDSL-type esterase/lipase family protein [Anaerolineae bacterium]|nr:GDSL-type esterase/lipase family protein [Anaerolineae bacterium]HNS49948.1 GDSL-type esterase/lipase family protein [Anaerolineae bacterium]